VWKCCFGEQIEEETEERLLRKLIRGVIISFVLMRTGTAVNAVVLNQVKLMKNVLSHEVKINVSNCSVIK